MQRPSLELADGDSAFCADELTLREGQPDDVKSVAGSLRIERFHELVLPRSAPAAWCRGDQAGESATASVSRRMTSSRPTNTGSPRIARRAKQRLPLRTPAHSSKGVLTSTSSTPADGETSTSSA
jgi:hypothetical protein